MTTSLNRDTSGLKLMMQYVQDVDLYDVLGNGMFPGRWSTGEVELEINDLVTLA